MGAYELLGQLRKEGLSSPLQIYRALGQLVEDGMVHRIESLNAYTYIPRNECGPEGHAVFSICTSCGTANRVHDPTMDKVLNRIAQRQGFHTRAVTVELSGLCEDCTHG